MHCLCAHKKLATVLVPIIFLLFSLKGNMVAGNPGAEKFKRDNYTLEVTRETFQVRQLVKGSEVISGGYNKKLDVDISDEFGMSTEKKVLEGLVDSFEISIGLRTDLAGLDLKRELRREILDQTTRFNKETIVIKVAIPITINVIPCYNRRAFILYDRSRYTVKTTEKSWRRTRELPDFYWQENTGFQILIESKYDEKYSASCEIPGSSKPVSGEDGNQLWAYIRYQNKGIYVVPLYWDKDRKIIDVMPLLPEQVQKGLQD